MNKLDKLRLWMMFYFGGVVVSSIVALLFLSINFLVALFVFDLLLFYRTIDPLSMESISVLWFVICGVTLSILNIGMKRDMQKSYRENDEGYSQTNCVTSTICL